MTVVGFLLFKRGAVVAMALIFLWNNFYCCISKMMGDETKTQLVLHSYWRSSCSWRVRAALAIKKVPYKIKVVSLLQDGGQHLTEEYSSKNPMRAVPTLEIGKDIYLTQSLAIIEYLEEMFPEPNLLPRDPFDRAVVRKLSLIITADIQPVQNMRILKKVTELADSAASQKWAHDAIQHGFVALEKELEKYSGEYCFKNQVSIADICLIPQVYNANRYTHIVFIFNVLFE